MTSFLLVATIGLEARDAPVTTAGSVTECPGASFAVPVSVTGFSLVTAITLRMDFDPTLMTYISYSGLNPSLAGMVINVVNVNANLTKVLVVWTSIVPLTLPAGSKFFDLNFTLLTGDPVLTFNNDAGGGSECEYADENGIAMNDLPTSLFYFNGIITNNSVLPAGPITGDTDVCQGETAVVYSIVPIANATGYSWTVPPGATIAGGANTNAITVDFSLSASAGTITAAGVNSCGTGMPSSLPVAISSLPVPIITGSTSECDGATEVQYDTEQGMTGYLWTISGGGVITSGQSTAIVRVTWNDPGLQNVTVTYTNQFGCPAQFPTMLPVTVRPLPAPPVISYPNDTLISSYPEGNQWYLNSSAIPGADSSVYIPLEDGYYTARVTQDGCTSDSSNSIYVLVTGLPETNVTSTTSISIFPNPGQGIFTLTPNPLCSGAVVQWCIQVYDHHGVRVFEKQEVHLEGNSTVTLDLRHLPAGLYTLVLSNDAAVIVKKILKC